MSTDKRATNHSVGRSGEQFAANYLERILGWQVVARNWRCQIGELDIVAQDDGATVIVEVKTRHSERMGAPVEAVNEAKRRQLARLAKWYCSAEGIAPDDEIRVDVIGLLMSSLEVRAFVHIRDALMM